VRDIWSHFAGSMSQAWGYLQLSTILIIAKFCSQFQSALTLTYQLNPPILGNKHPAKMRRLQLETMCGQCRSLHQQLISWSDLNSCDIEYDQCISCIYYIYYIYIYQIVSYPIIYIYIKYLNSLYTLYLCKNCLTSRSARIPSTVPDDLGQLGVPDVHAALEAGSHVSIKSVSCLATTKQY